MNEEIIKDDTLENALERARKVREEENEKMSKMTKEELSTYIKESTKDIIEWAESIGLKTTTI